MRYTLYNLYNPPLVLSQCWDWLKPAPAALYGVALNGAVAE